MNANRGGQIHRRKSTCVISPVASVSSSGKTCVPDIEKGIPPVALIFRERTTACTILMIESLPPNAKRTHHFGRPLVLMVRLLTML